MEPCRLVAYYRVSTAKQGASGLGLEGQQAAVLAYAKARGCEIIKAFTEVESGKDNARPQLLEAIDHARRVKAILVIAKLDRLSRNSAFLNNLLEAGVEFVACDNPTTNQFTIRILAAVAQEETEKISERTKAALAAYKARGGLLGGARPDCANLTHEARLKGGRRSSEARRQKARSDDALIEPIIVGLKAEGLTLKAIADRLNDMGKLTRKGSRWSGVQVKRVLDRSGYASA